ncbi:hypothetical protein MKY87_01245 [Paenibacillus sp. FSL R7-0198]|uniref:hypothetical protein n=1 Tax=Paenibacillus TaxID=44249 RepID=UPI000B81BC4F|nr:hypothetical protein [Paenibacillus amylolyticus]
MVTLNAVLTTAVASVGLWLLLAGLTEALTEVVKTVLPIKDRATYGVSIVVGVGLAISFGLNPFGLTGISAYTSMVAAGLLASRGANYLNGWLKRFGIHH